MLELLKSLNPVQMIAFFLLMIVMIAVICTMCKRSGGGHGGDHGGAGSGGGGGSHGDGGGGKRKSRKGLIRLMIIFTFMPIFYIVLTLSFKDNGATLKINDVKTVQARAQKIQNLVAGTAEKVRSVLYQLVEPPTK